MDTTPVSLLKSLRQHEDRESWNEFERLYQPWLRGFLTRTVPATDVDDVLQEVLLTLVRELPGFEHNRQKGAFRRWLRLVIANRVREFWRSRANQPLANEEFQRRCLELADERSEPSRNMDREHDRHLVEQLLLRIAGDFEPGTWRAFRAFVLEGHSAAEVARTLGISEGAVWTAKSRVMQRLRQIAEDLLD